MVNANAAAVAIAPSLEGPSVRMEPRFIEEESFPARSTIMVSPRSYFNDRCQISK